MTRWLLLNFSLFSVAWLCDAMPIVDDIGRDKLLYYMRVNDFCSVTTTQLKGGQI